MKFSIRDLLLVTVIVAVCSQMNADLSAADDSKLPDFANSYWVVNDSYDGGKHTRDSVGDFMVLESGKVYFASPKDGMATYVLRPLRSDVGERFEMLEDGALFASALLIRERGKATLYVNQTNPANGKAPAPEPKINRCDHVFECTPISEAVGKSRLKGYATRP